MSNFIKCLLSQHISIDISMYFNVYSKDMTLKLGACFTL